MGGWGCTKFGPVFRARRARKTLVLQQMADRFPNLSLQGTLEQFQIATHMQTDHQRRLGLRGGVAKDSGTTRWTKSYVTQRHPIPAPSKSALLKIAPSALEAIVLTACFRSGRGRKLPLRGQQEVEYTFHLLK